MRIKIGGTNDDAISKDLNQPEGQQCRTGIRNKRMAPHIGSAVRVQRAPQRRTMRPDCTTCKKRLDIEPQFVSSLIAVIAVWIQSGMDDGVKIAAQNRVNLRYAAGRLLDNDPRSLQGGKPQYRMRKF